MTYMLRDRPDGQVEIVLTKPILVGIFPERDIAQRVCAFLQDEAIDWTVEQPAGFATAAADVSEMQAVDLEDLAAELAPEPTRARPSGVRNLPAVVPATPLAPPVLTPAPAKLTEAEIDAAFRRLTEGEKLTEVAATYGISMGQMRGMWAAHRKKLQAHLAEGGQVSCSLCARPFTPSISHPETCARCSHE